jgi:trigger factor
MQVTETLAEGLKRSFKVVVPVADLNDKVSKRLDDLKDRVQIKGFRPGKVPVAHLKRLYGRSALAEAIEEAVQETNARIVSDNGFKLALQPKISLPENQEEVAGVFEGKADLSYTVDIEILPKVTLSDVRTITVNKPVADVADSDIDEALNRIGEQNRPFEAKAEGAAAASGDKLTIDFVGSIDGVPFEGGAGNDLPLVIGSNTFIPGFEDQLVGQNVGETRTISVTFPEDYGAANLAGKAASFEVTLKGLATPGALSMDDEMAKTLGMESLDKLKEAIRTQIGRENDLMSRQKAKRQLLDALDAAHQFELPAGLVSQEFDGIWKTVEEDLKRSGKTFADEGTTEEAARADYGKIAERRVRLGLVLAEIGEKNEIKVTDEEVSRALVERARQFPGQEQMVWDYYRKNPDALASLRAPIFEEKVVDFLLALATVTETKVPRAELLKQDEDDKAA